MIRERVEYNGQVCTITDKKGRQLRLRDPFGFDLGWIAKRKTVSLPDGDERKAFKVGDDS